MIQNPPGILIRRLQASDLPRVAEVHQLAFPDSALSMLGVEAVRRYYEWQLIGPHEVTALSAYIDTELVGFCFGGMFRGALSGFVRTNQKYLIGRVLTHPWLITNPIFRDRLSTGTRALKRRANPGESKPRVTATNGHRFGILAIAVHPQRQGLGIGKLLMEDAERIARQCGYQQMDLTVSPDNRQAIRFYEGLEWRKISRDTNWKGQMTKSLAS